MYNPPDILSLAYKQPIMHDQLQLLQEKEHSLETAGGDSPNRLKLENDLERYYPVKTSDGRYQAIYEKYKQLASRDPRLHFIGRCGTYQYLDMDQVINQSLRGAHKWLASLT